MAELSTCPAVMCWIYSELQIYLVVNTTLCETGEHAGRPKSTGQLQLAASTSKVGSTDDLKYHCKFTRVLEYTVISAKIVQAETVHLHYNDCFNVKPSQNLLHFSLQQMSARAHVCQWSWRWW